ncbi:MAG: pyrroline-5-carboxylate reductase [bacterium]|nr:pyrroline-5-carboxylate reductase [bacterium]
MSIHNIHIAFIGAGNMAEALIKGLLDAHITSSDKLIAADVNHARLTWLAEEYAITPALSNTDAVGRAEMIVLAVKPQHILQVLAECAPSARTTQTFVSIAAGITLSRLEAALPPRTAVIRAMPNTPALVQRGVTAIARGTYAHDTDFHRARDLFLAVGKVLELPESLMDAVTAVSGSGPAYVFYLMEAMIAAATTHGLSLTDAHTLVVETVRGAGELAARFHEDPRELRRRVTSPGGTTEAAIRALDARKVKDALVAAIAAAANRSRELGA